MMFMEIILAFLCFFQSFSLPLDCGIMILIFSAQNRDTNIQIRKGIKKREKKIKKSDKNIKGDLSYEENKRLTFQLKRKDDPGQ